MITINQQPPTNQLTPTLESSIMPVYNPVFWEVSSDNVLECGFKYVADVYVNGINVKRLKRFPDGSGNGGFNIAAVLQDYLDNSPIIYDTDFNPVPERILTYTIHFGEEYDSSSSCDGISVVYPDLVVTDDQFAWNGAMQYKEWREYNSFDSARFLLSYGPDKGEFLTTQPDNIMIGMGESAELCFFNMPGSTAGGKLVINTFDADGVFITTAGITNAYSPAGAGDMFMSVQVGPDNINNSVGYPLINSAVYSYNVFLQGGMSSGLLSNPTLQYLGGANSWTTSSYPGCSTTFGITVANKMQFIIPDVSCGNQLTLLYNGTGGSSFIPGQTYNITFTVDNVNNPSGEAQYVQFRLNGVAGTAYGGVGTFISQITAGSSPTGLEIIGYFDADTGGFGSHSFSLTAIQAVLVGGTRTSEIKSYKIDRRPSRYCPMRFKWLNKLGGQDSYSFNLAKIDRLNIQRTEFDKLLLPSYDLGDRGRKNIAITSTQSVQAASNWLTQDESDWIIGLFESPDVYVQDTNPIYTFWKMAPNDPGYPDELPLFLLTCPLKEQFIVDNLDSQYFFVDKNDKTYNADVDDIIMMKQTLSNSALQGQTTLGSPILDDSGIMYLSGVTLEFNPIILTTSSVEEKTKARTKNINYNVEFEYANDKNIQRG